MTKQFRVSTTLPQKLKELGLSPDAVLRRAGLPMGLFKMDKILVSTEEFFALHRGIAEASNDPCFGLKLGSEERVERYDPVKIAAISARSFRDAIERISRYKQLTCPEEIRVVERGKESAVQFLWLLALEKEPPLLVDVCFAWIVSMAHRGIGRRLGEHGITFQRLLDEARHELARHYLLHSSREVSETAYLLGYEDANSFYRAFHQWEGTTPGQWRLLQKSSATEAQIGAA